MYLPIFPCPQHDGADQLFLSGRKHLDKNTYVKADKSFHLDFKILKPWGNGQEYRLDSMSLSILLDLESPLQPIAANKRLKRLSSPSQSKSKRSAKKSRPAPLVVTGIHLTDDLNLAIPDSNRSLAVASTSHHDSYHDSETQYLHPFDRNHPILPITSDPKLLTARALGPVDDERVVSCSWNPVPVLWGMAGVWVLWRLWRGSLV